MSKTKESKSSPFQTKQAINKVARDAKARDNISNAFAGNENNGPKRSNNHKHSTNVKSRKTDASRGKTPKR